MTLPDWATELYAPDLVRAARGRVSHRKLRLLACACCRRWWDGHPPADRRRVELAERYADGRLTADRLGRSFPARVRGGRGDRSLRLATHAVGWPDAEPPDREPDPAAGGPVLRPWAAGEYAEHATVRVLLGVAGYAAGRAVEADPGAGLDRLRSAMLLESAYQADLVRCIVPDPARPVAFAPDWRTDTAVALARRMYDARDFALTPILADALDDAGCDRPDLLAHLRTPGPHARGCWVVDEVLGLS